MGSQEYLKKKEHNLEAETGETTILCLHLVHTSIKLYDDIIDSELVMGCTRILITQKKKT